MNSVRSGGSISGLTGEIWPDLFWTNLLMDALGLGANDTTGGLRLWVAASVAYNIFKTPYAVGIGQRSCSTGWATGVMGISLFYSRYVNTLTAEELTEDGLFKVPF